MNGLIGGRGERKPPGEAVRNAAVVPTVRFDDRVDEQGH